MLTGKHWITDLSPEVGMGSAPINLHGLSTAEAGSSKENWSLWLKGKWLLVGFFWRSSWPSPTPRDGNFSHFVLFSGMSNSALVLGPEPPTLQANHALLNQDILTAEELHLYSGSASATARTISPNSANLPPPGCRLQSVASSRKPCMTNTPRLPLKCLLLRSFCVTFTKCFQLECLQSHLSDMSVIRVLRLEGHPGPVWEG